MMLSNDRVLVNRMRNVLVIKEGKVVGVFDRGSRLLQMKNQKVILELLKLVMVSARRVCGEEIGLRTVRLVVGAMLY